MKVEIFPIDLRLKREFVIAGGQTRIKRNYALVLDGIGLGEASGSVKYGPLPKVIENDLKKVERTLTDLNESVWKDSLEQLSADICPAALCAFSTAICDREARRSRRPLHEYFGLQTPAQRKTSVTISVGDIDVVRQWLSAGYDIIKIKMDDNEAVCRAGIEMIKSCPAAHFRIDANGSWSYAHAVDVVTALPIDRVEMIEQPFPPEAEDDWQRLHEITHIPLFMDESIATPADIKRVAGIVDGVNIKLQKSGRLETAIAAMREAKRFGLKIMIGCMIESSVGVAAAYCLSGPVDYIDLDGCLLAEDETFCGLEYRRGLIEIADHYGHGITKK
jgi:L-Ala-D/L-Glu epimerase